MLIVAGIACASLGNAIGVEAVGIFLMLVGFLGLVMLAFLEVGLSEDHDRALDEARRAEQAAASEPHPQKRLRLPRRARGPGWRAGARRLREMAHGYPLGHGFPGRAGHRGHPTERSTRWKRSPHS